MSLWYFFYISFFFSISFSYFFISIIDANRDNDTDGWMGHKGSMSTVHIYGEVVFLHVLLYDCMLGIHFFVS